MKPDWHPSRLKISGYSYELPEELIAKHPLKNRDTSRLLVYRNKTSHTSIFKDLPDILDKNTLMVFNSSRVIPARLNFTTSRNKNVELFCLEPARYQVPSEALKGCSPQRWNCLVGNLRAWEEDVLVLEKEGLRLTVSISKRLQNFVEVNFDWNSTTMNFAELLRVFGEMPIPPYLKRKSESSDKSQYQTLYAEQEGSVAAPTAGLHFTETVMRALQEKGIEKAYLKLHVGAGTFKPVKSEVLEGHDMHSEWLEVSLEFIEHLANTGNAKVLAVGTTSLRCLESLYWMGFKLIREPKLSLEDLQIRQWEVYDLLQENLPVQEALKGLISWMKEKKMERLICKTGILIAPPYKMKVVHTLLTNFHQPGSTLLLLVAAFIGEEWRGIYDYAIQKKFRFLSYGDAMLLQP